MASLAITPALLARAARRNGYAVPSKGLVFFGIRGLSPDEPFENGLASSRSGTFSPVDFKRMSCSLGQWAIEDGKIALFPGSTVPSLPNIVRARANAGSGTNMLMLGRYEHEKGMHKAGKPGGHRAFRQAVFFPVWRTVDDLDYDLADRLDLGSGPGSFVFDNLHSSYAAGLEDPYSSAGCQVVCGLPKSPSRNNSPETGPWRSFVERAYAVDQSRFVYLLFAAEELALLDRSDEASLTQVVRYGSTGRAAELVQRALKAKGFLDDEPDGDFLRRSLAALVKFQAQVLSPAVADGICGGATAAALGITLPPLASATDAPVATTAPATAVGDMPDPEDESDLPPNELRPLLVALGLLRPVPQAPITEAATPPTSSAVPDSALLSRQNFERCQAIVKEFEGGFSNDPKDPGGATNFGITLATLSAARKRPVTPAEVRAMTYDEAKDIYFAEYWNRSSCGAMPGPLALAIYNIAVHAGLGTAARFLQRALNANGASVAVDGGIGGETLGAIPSAPLPDLVCDVIDLYEDKLRAHPNFEHFKRGFLARVTKLRAETERWLNESAATRPPIPTPKVTEEDDPAMDTQINTFLADLLRNLTQRPGAAPERAPEPAPHQAAGGAPAEILALILRALQAGPASVAAQGKAEAVNGLTPVNAALGTGIGTLLDGKKSAIGIIGSLLAWVLEPGNPLGGVILGAFGPAGLGVAAVAQTLLPFFLALGSWGVLGKMDKYAAGITVPTPEKPRP